MDSISIKGQVFPTLVAITPEEHQRGLMFQAWPPPIMVFPYRTSSCRKFWMKNCISPLDIIFCNSNRVVGICKGTPLSTEMIGPNKESDMVVELPAGMAERLGLNLGDYVGFSPTNNTLEKQARFGVSF